MESAQQRAILTSFKASLIAQYGHCRRSPSAAPTGPASSRKSLLPNPPVPTDPTEIARLSGLNQNEQHPTPAPEQRTNRPDIIEDHDQKVAPREAPVQKPALQNEIAQKPVTKEQRKKHLSFLRKSKPQGSSPNPTTTLPDLPYVTREQMESRVSAVPAGQSGSYELQPQKSPVISERTVKLRTKYPDVVRILEENGFPVGHPDFKKGEALIWAAGNGHKAVVRCLILEYGFSDEFVKMDSLFAAAKGGHTAIISLFLDLNFVDPRRKYCYFKTAPLHEVVRFGNEASVQAILDDGPDIGAICQRGQSALHEAAAYGNACAVRLLVKSDAPLSAVDSNRQTALHLAAEHGHSNVVKILLESGIGTHEKSLNGLTALHLATQNGYPEVVKLLLERKAHVNAADDEGKTPLNYAVDARNQEIAQLLSMNGGKASLEAHTPVRTSSGRGLEIFGFGGKDFSWSPDTGLEPIKKKTSDQHHATGFDYEPGYIDEVY